jgi:peptide/nickel transport system ATP-binding protein
MPAVTVNGLSVALASGQKVVEDIAFALEDGEVLGIVGESGSGKSTISLALMGHCRDGSRIVAGSAVVAGTDVLSFSPARMRAIRGHLVTYVPQDPSVSLNPAIRIAEQLTEGLVHAAEPLDGKEALARAKAALEAVGLPTTDEFLARYPGQLSGGQQQRVGIAMAVVPRPRLMVLDEPTTGLDVVTQGEVLDLISTLCRTHRMAAIYVSHDLEVVSHVADKVMVLYCGRVVEYGMRGGILERPQHPYTVSLLNALPSVGHRRLLKAIAGHAPAIGGRPAGCTFAPRCAFVSAECREAEPAVLAVGPGHTARCIRPGAAGRPIWQAEKARRTSGATVSVPRLEVRDLRLAYGSKTVLAGASFQLMSGECLALVGESGSGKSTLSRCIIGLTGRYDGEVRLDGMVLSRAVEERSREVRRNLQYVFQNPYRSLNPRRTVGATLKMAFEHLFPGRGHEARDVVLSTMARVGLTSALASRFPSDLSGGERQRVAIARALVCQPSVLVCDEVTSALDVSVQAAVVELLRELMDGGLSILFVTHNLAVVRSIADRVAVLRHGAIVELGSSDQILDHPRSEYAQTLIAETRRISSFAAA